MDGICIFEKVVKTQSYVAFLKMRRLTAYILFGYLEARKLESEAVAGAAGGTSTLLWGFNLFVSSEGHIFNRTNAHMHTKSASLAIVKGLQCLVHHLDPGFLILGPFKPAVEFRQLHSRPVASGAGVNASGVGGWGGGGQASFLASLGRGVGANVTAEERATPQHHVPAAVAQHQPYPPPSDELKMMQTPFHETGEMPAKQQQKQLRIDPADGNAYPLGSVLEFYGEEEGKPHSSSREITPLPRFPLRWATDRQQPSYTGISRSHVFVSCVCQGIFLLACFCVSRPLGLFSVCLSLLSSCSFPVALALALHMAPLLNAVVIALFSCFFACMSSVSSSSALCLLDIDQYS
jgi:hypothetical protein